MGVPRLSAAPSLGFGPRDLSQCGRLGSAVAAKHSQENWNVAGLEACRREPFEEYRVHRETQRLVEGLVSGARPERGVAGQRDAADRDLESKDLVVPNRNERGRRVIAMFFVTMVQGGPLSTELPRYGGERAREVIVIRVNPTDQLTRGARARLVQRMGLAAVGLRFGVSQPLRVARKDRGRFIGAAAIHDEDFEIGIILEQHGPDRFLNVRALLKRGANDGDPGPSAGGRRRIG